MYIIAELVGPSLSPRVPVASLLRAQGSVRKLKVRLLVWSISSLALLSVMSV